MEFTFTATPNTVTSTSTSTSASTSAPGTSINTFNGGNVTNPFLGTETRHYNGGVIPSFDNTQDSQYERVPVKKEYGIGDTKQWRQRIIDHVGDRIKDRRTVIQNSRRAGLHKFNSNNSEDNTNKEQMFPTVERTSAEMTNLSEEEERRIVVETWETFKRENLEALAQAYQGMTEEEIEGIERDILLHDYSAYDPIYDVEMDMEMNEMEQTIEDYIRLEETYASILKEDPEMASEISLSMTILSNSPCPQCQQGALVFESGNGTNKSSPIKASCAACKFSLEKEALHYIATTARSHSERCSSRVQLVFDIDTGLLLVCPQCDLLA